MKYKILNYAELYQFAKENNADLAKSKIDAQITGFEKDPNLEILRGMIFLVCEIENNIRIKNFIVNLIDEI